MSVWIYVFWMCVFFLSCCICVDQVEEEQLVKREESKEEMVELRTWNQQKDNYDDDTQVIIITISATH